VPRCSWIESAAFLAVLALAGSALADEPPVVELSESQLDLNTRAIELIQEKRLEEAASLFESSLSLGKSNVTYLNLGRTLARLGRCEEAGKVYDEVDSAPRVSDPPPEAVLDRLQTFRAELSTCGTKVVLECHPPTLKIRVDDGDPFECPAGPLGLDTGSYTVVAIGEDGSERPHRIEARPDETIRLVLSIETAREEPEVVVQGNPIEAPPRTDPSPGTRHVVGLTVGIMGLATVATAVLVDVALTTPKVAEYNRARTDARTNDDFDEQRRLLGEANRLQTVGKILFPIGGVLTATGVGLWMWPSAKGDAATVAVRWRFVF